MITKKYVAHTIIIAVFVSLNISSKATGETSVVVSTSMLASAARNIFPQANPLHIVSLLPPSSCPGHYDLSPRTIPLLKSAILLIRHDYQGEIEEKIVAIGADGASFQVVITPGSPLIPSNYYLLTKQIGTIFGSVFPEFQNEITASIDSVEHRIGILSQQTLITAARWKGRPVIAATHVADFCAWLGFDVVGIIKRPENMTPLDYQNLFNLSADMIVANLQEGIQGAESLGNRMKRPVAILSNFPGADGYGYDYYDLFYANVSQLEKAWVKR